MEEILHHQGCKNPVNNWINCISIGAGFLPPRVLYQYIISIIPTIIISV